jgi:hypothetical protein
MSKPVEPRRLLSTLHRWLTREPVRELS